MLAYFKTIGLQFDELLCAILFGVMNTTISMHVALEMQAGKKWACLFCDLLSLLVQRNHCQDQLDNVPMSTGNYIRAFIALLVLAVIILVPIINVGSIMVTFIWNELAKIM